MNTLDTSMHGRDLWMRCTDERGASTYSEHRVWDADRFLDARLADAARLNVKHGTDKARAERITHKEYRKATQ